MVLNLVLLVALAALAGARKAPHADYVNQVFRSSRDARFSDNVMEDASLDVPGLVQKYGYPIEVHNMITPDGYMLEVHRIPHGRDNFNKPDRNKPVVFVMHGLLSSSADFLVLGPGNAIGYLLAEAGYDVWLGNARGNFYSRRHRNLNPDSTLNSNFWKFSWDEIGNIDLPTMIDYALERTGQKKLHYIGHSQGGTSFLVLNSLRPEYNEKFISFQGLAPASFFHYNENEMFHSMAPFENVIESAAFAMGQAEIFGNRDFIGWFQRSFCNDSPSILSGLCVFSIDSIAEREHYNATMVPIFLAHSPAGASVRQIAHYGQVIRFEAFRRYNHNVLTNLATYGKASPPEYNLSKITAPVYIHYGQNDKEVHYKDIHLLASSLPNVRKMIRAARESFNHFDFIWAMDAKVQVYDAVLSLMKEAERKL